eukprot:TRINITY_DN36913_c0_g1_i1.p1 TRINITY_DN36913_c0_g1~~TRINITY_DN36913_c0_g1_i1.p1  ORF type:complete len:304 (+),score=38.18 TRINITY_DN36913_c0_g1_i1:82-912(+)
MSIRFWRVNAFTHTDPRGRGNPAAVCLLKKPATEMWMKAVSREMNLSETAFLVQRPQRDGFDLRWFTPTVEIDICGHATLACASVIFAEGMEDDTRRVRFHTRSGVLVCTQLTSRRIAMNFPIQPPRDISQPPTGLAEALGVESFRYCGRNNLYHLVEVDSAAQVRSMQPDFVALARVKQVLAVCVVAAPEPESPFHYVYRLFEPNLGVNEDPVCGSANCCTAPYWHRRTGDTTFIAYDASERGGVVHVTLEGDRVLLAGETQLILQGELLFEEEE